MHRPTTRRVLCVLAIVGAVPMVTGCPKKEEAPAVPDAAPPPPEPVDAAPTVLEPLEDDAGDAGADADAAPAKKAGGGYSPNVARLKQCCNQLSAEAKRLGASPEAGMLAAAAAQCSTLAGQAGPSGTAPELGVLRGLLQGRNVPAVCAGF